MTEYGRFTDAHGLLDLLARRKAELGLSNGSLERVCDMAPGQVDKYIGPSRLKSPSVWTLFLLLDALGMSGSLHIDAHKETKRKADWETEGRRNERSVRPSERISKALVARARPAVLSEFSRRGNEIRWKATSPAERKRISKWLNAQPRRKRRPGTV